MSQTLSTDAPRASVSPDAAGSVAATMRPPSRRGFGAGLPRWWRGGGLWSVLLATPLLVIFVYFAWLPIVNGLLLSLQKTNFLSSRWVGLDNFAFVLTDPLLPVAVGNTAWFAVLAVVIGFPLPLLMAILMGELRRSRGLFSVLAYLPVVVPPVVAILLWTVFYNPESSGLLNTILGAVGLGPFPWLNSTTTVIPAMVVEATWAAMGNTVIIYLAALVGVRPELYEAAELDGAGIVRRIWHVTLPQLRGIVLVMLLLTIIGTLQVFTEPFLFTGGGPEDASVTVLMLIYRYGFLNANFGAAAALSALLAGALAIISIAYAVATRRWSEK